MSRDQKFVIVALVLGNLILYALAFYSMPTQSAQAPASSPATVVQVAAAATSTASEFTPTSAPTDIPSDTPTPEQTAAPTETPTIGVVATETLAVTPTPTLLPTLPAGMSLRYTPTVRPLPTGGTPLYPPPTRTPRPPTATPTKPPSGGTDPSNALAPGDTWRTIGPNASVWYKIGTGGNHIVATLQAQPLDGMRFDVYAPNLWDKPIGAGSRSNGVDGLVWAGGRWENYGDWFARVTNGNGNAVTYRLTTNTQEIPACEVIGYWEYIGTNYVYWKKCK